MGLIRKEDLHESLLNSISNPNLLINGNFQINQRGNTNYTNGYTVDRWMLTSDSNLQLDVLDKGVRITDKSIGTWDNFCTKFDCSDFKHLLGKTLTLTFKLLTPTTKVNQIWGMCRNTENEHYYFNYGLMEDPDFYKDGPISIISKTFTLDQIYSDGYIEFGIQMISNVGNSIEIEWAKLEIGDHLTPFVPRPYAEELALCQRYYERSTHHTRGLIASDLMRLSIDIQYKQTKRIVPTLKVYGLNNEESTVKGKIDSNEMNFPINIFYNTIYGFGCIDVMDKKGQSIETGEAFEIYGWEANAEIY